MEMPWYMSDTTSDMAAFEFLEKTGSPSGLAADNSHALTSDIW
jgi:hypothetical protein